MIHMNNIRKTAIAVTERREIRKARKCSDVTEYLRISHLDNYISRLARYNEVHGTRYTMMFQNWNNEVSCIKQENKTGDLTRDDIVSILKEIAIRAGTNSAGEVVMIYEQSQLKEKIKTRSRRKNDHE